MTDKDYIESLGFKEMSNSTDRSGEFVIANDNGILHLSVNYPSHVIDLVFRDKISDTSNIIFDTICYSTNEHLKGLIHSSYLHWRDILVTGLPEGTEDFVNESMKDGWADEETLAKMKDVEEIFKKGEWSCWFGPYTPPDKNTINEQV